MDISEHRWFSAEHFWTFLIQWRTFPDKSDSVMNISEQRWFSDEHVWTSPTQWGPFLNISDSKLDLTGNRKTSEYREKRKKFCFLFKLIMPGNHKSRTFRISSNGFGKRVFLETWFYFWFHIRTLELEVKTVLKNKSNTADRNKCCKSLWWSFCRFSREKFKIFAPYCSGLDQRKSISFWADLPLFRTRQLNLVKPKNI